MDRSASRFFAPSLTRLESRDSQSSLSATSNLSGVSFLIPASVSVQSATYGHATTSPSNSTAGLAGRVAIDPIIVVALPPNLNPPQPVASTHPNAAASSESSHALSGLLDAVSIAAPTVPTTAPATSTEAASSGTVIHPTNQHTLFYPPPQPHAPVRVPVG